MSDEEIPMDKLARVYRKIQGKIEELTAVYERELAELKEKQDILKIQLKDQMLALNMTSVKTAEGTVVMSTKTRYSATDWDALRTFIKENDALDLLEKRVAQTNMGQFIKDHPDNVPPGIQTQSEYVISVRKPTTK